jgi:hypothetical protein
MATLIRNKHADAIALPFPYSGVLDGGMAAVAAGTPAEVLAKIGASAAAVFELLEVDDSQLLNSPVAAELLASVATGKGASMIGIEDAAHNITATTVEGALAEIVVSALAGDGSQPAKLLSTDVDKGAILVGVHDTANHITGVTVEAALAELALEKYELGLTTSGKGASHIGIFDTATIYTAVNVETALAEVKTLADATKITADAASPAATLAAVTTGNGASKIGVEDSANKITGTTVETALAELALEKAALGLTTNGNGASHIGIEDALNLLTAANVEAALAELVKYHALALADPGGANAAIGVTRSATVNLTIGSAGAETNTLAIPSFVGQIMLINADTVGTGTRAVTASYGINKAGNTHITFAAARDSVALRAVTVGGALRWEVTATDGASLS